MQLEVTEHPVVMSRSTDSAASEGSAAAPLPPHAATALAASEWPGTAEAGLLVIHGVGSHARTSTLDRFVSPLLERLAVEGQFVHAEALQVGDPEQPGGLFAGLIVQHSDPGDTHSLAVVEAGWSDSYLPDGRDRISPWVASRSPRMVWEVARYHSRGPWRATLTAVMAALLVAAAVLLNRGYEVRALWALGLGLLVGVGMVWVDDFADVRSSGHTLGDRVRMLMGVLTLLMFQVQRALVLVVLLVGMFVFPVLVVVVRLIASVPYASRFAGGLLQAIETVFTTGGVADMHAIVRTPVTAAAIHARTRSGLRELERMVRPGGVITVVAHSGGAPLAWWLLSEPPIHARQEHARFRYRLFTVGAALNWSLRGFRGYGTPLDQPLVNHGEQDEAAKTWWLNVYGTWDPVSHGPVPPGEFKQWRTWSDDANVPNRAVRNLGAPVPDEHGEYWRNQQEFVPLVWRALVPDSTWAGEAAGRDHQLWSNCRLALLSALVRTRLVILAVPVAGVLALLRRDSVVSEAGYQSAIWSGLSSALETSLGTVVGEGRAESLAGWLNDTPVVSGAIILAVMTLLAYVLTDLYTNFFWAALGRRVEAFKPLGRGRVTLVMLAVVAWVPSLILAPALLRTRDAEAWMWAACVAASFALLLVELIWAYRDRGAALALAAILTWAPSVLVLPVLVGDYQLGWAAWGVITGLNTLLAVAEIHWFFGCIRALDDTDAEERRVYGQAIGRQRVRTGN